MNASRRKPGYIIYLFPGIIDLLLGIIIFVNPVRASKMGASFTQTAALSAIWGIVYMISCILIGGMVTPKNAVRFMLTSCVMLAVLCGFFILLSSLTWMYILVGIAGVSCALFFPAFQIFMKSIDGGMQKPLAHSSGMYTFSWSAGIATGPFLSGFLMELGQSASGNTEPIGWMYCYMVGALGALGTGVGIALFDRWIRHAPADPDTTDSTHAMRTKADNASDPAEAQVEPEQAATPEPVTDYSKMPDLAWLGWICSGFGFLVVSVLRGIFPKGAHDYGLSDSMQGAIVFTMFFTQALTGLFLSRSRTWMYRPRLIGLFGLIGVTGIFCYGLGHTAGVYLAASVLFGIYTGSISFYLVFHSLAHPSRSARYVSINETVVGGVGVLGPVFGGVLADWQGFGFPMLVAGLIGSWLIVFQMMMHYRSPADLSQLKRA